MKKQTTPKPIRKIVIWAILIIICIPNVLFAPTGAKVAALLLAALLIWWDNQATKKDPKARR